MSLSHDIKMAQIPKQLFLPLAQHLGQAATPIVNIGDKVLKGQLIADQDGFISARIHAPSSGTITAITKLPIPHPSALDADCIVIETDGKDEWIDHQGAKSPELLNKDEIRHYVQQAGIVGLGGAVFPSAVKLDVSPDKNIHTVVINAAECEPYITCDDMLMRERAEEVILGARLIQKALNASTCIIGIEDNKPEAYEILLKATLNYSDDGVQVTQIPAIYPAGGEKQLIKVLTNEEVPSQGLPTDVGIICHNVGTAAAVYRAVYHGEPLISRIITLTGAAIKRPGNYEALFGTPLGFLLESVEYEPSTVQRLLIGGPMMGFSLSDLRAPLIKSSNCILAAANDELDTPPPAMPCIRCGRCAEKCPMSLIPQQMYWYSKARDLEKVQDYNIFDCIECGCCSYVCPSNIPLVQYFRYAKSEIWGDENDKQKADIARERHDFQEIRKARAKAEKAAMAAKRKANLAKKKAAEEKKKAAAKDEETATSDSKAPSDKKATSDLKAPSDKKAPNDKTASSDNKTQKQETAKGDEDEDPIKAAMRRVKEKKAKSQANPATQPKNTDNLTPAQQKQVEQVDKRRADASEATSEVKIKDKQEHKVDV